MWLDRSDLRKAFDIFTPRGRDDYFEWFINGDARKEGVDGRSIAAAIKISGKAEPKKRLPVAAESVWPPWPSVSRQTWQGPSREAGKFLEGHVAALFDGKRLLVPVQVALQWELRSDLQAQYTLDTADSFDRFLAWALTHGVTEGGVDCDKFSAAFLRQMAEDSVMSGDYRDVPITCGLVATRFLESANAAYKVRHRFPEERAGRLAHGLWFTYVAARQFNWPRELVARLISYFEVTGNVEYGGFHLTNAMLAIWELRPDVQKNYPLDTEVSIIRYFFGCWPMADEKWKSLSINWATVFVIFCFQSRRKCQVSSAYSKCSTRSAATCSETSTLEPKLAGKASPYGDRGRCQHRMIQSHMWQSLRHYAATHRSRMACRNRRLTKRRLH